MNIIQIVRLANKINKSILAYKRNNNFTFLHNKVEIFKYIFAATITRHYYKEKFKTKKINNVKTISELPSPILDILIHQLKNHNLIDMYNEEYSKINNFRNVWVISDYIFKYYNKNHSIDIRGVPFIYNNYAREIEEIRFLSKSRFNLFYNGWYIIPILKNDDFNISDYIRDNIGTTIIRDSYDFDIKIINNKSIYLVFSPNRDYAYLYRRTKRGYHFIQRITNNISTKQGLFV